MIRKTLLAISVLLLVGTVGLWVGSYQRVDVVGWNGNTTRCSAVWCDGIFTLWSRFGTTPAELRPFYFKTRPAEDRFDDSSFDWERLDLLAIGMGVLYSVTLPFWVPTVALSVAAMVFARPWYRRRHYRRRHNLCLTCGYDLTGNVSGVCSECGTIIEKPSTEVA